MAHAASRERPLGPDWRPSSPQARSLAGLLRQERLTVLLGDDRESMSSLLTAGVLPLLGRRADDASAPAAGQLNVSVLSFPDRRKRPLEASTEILVLFDAGRERSVQLLESRFEASVRAAGGPSTGAGRCLGDRVEALCTNRKMQFLFIVDGFQAVLPTTGAPDAGQQAVIDELVELLERPLPANVLLAATTASWAYSTPFTARLNQVEPLLFSVTAQRADATPRPPGLRLQASGGVAASTASVPVPPRREESQEGDEDDLPAAFSFSRTLPLQAAFDAPRVQTGRRKAVAAGCALLVAVGLVSWWNRPQPQVPPSPVAVSDLQQPSVPRPVTNAAPIHPIAPAPALTRLSAPPLPLVSDGEEHLSSRMLGELREALGSRPDGQQEPTVVRSVVAGDEAPSPARIRLAVASYDDLRHVAASEGAAPVTVIAPLGTDTIDVLVRSDSPLHSLDELEGKRIDVGAPGASRAMTAAMLYRKMFGVPLRARQAVAEEAPAAIRDLIQGGEVDAVLMLGSQTQGMLASLPSADRLALRKLTLQKSQPASRRAMQDYLPVSGTSIDGAPVPEFAMLNFLVATGPIDGTGATQRLAEIANRLCGQLVRLQREGDAAWRGVQPGLRPPIELRHVDTRVIDTAWAACRPEASVAPSIRK